MSKEQFVDAIASSGQGRMAADMLWDKLVEARVCDRLTPYPDDDLLQVFGLAEEDLDEDVILEIIEATGSLVPGRDVLKRFVPVNTPADIVKLIEVTNTGSSIDAG